MGGSQGHAAALAHAGRDQRPPDQRRDLGRHGQSPRGVDEQPGVIVRLGGRQSTRQEPSGTGLASRPDVWGIGTTPPTALAARVHHEVREAGARPVQPLGRPAAAASVADELDDDRSRRGSVTGHEQPSGDACSAMATEADVEHLERRNDAFGGSRLDIERTSRLHVECSRPVVLEVVRFLDWRPIAPQLVKRQVELHRVSSRSPQWCCRVINHDVAAPDAAPVASPTTAVAGSARTCEVPLIWFVRSSIVIMSGSTPLRYRGSRLTTGRPPSPAIRRARRSAAPNSICGAGGSPARRTRSW